MIKLIKNIKVDYGNHLNLIPIIEKGKHHRWVSDYDLTHSHYTLIKTIVKCYLITIIIPFLYNITNYKCTLNPKMGGSAHPKCLSYCLLFVF